MKASDLKAAFQTVPTAVVNENEYNILDFLVQAQVVSSKTQARELVTTNAILINGLKVNDVDFTVTKSDAFDQEFTVIRKGKKNYFIAK